MTEDKIQNKILKYLKSLDNVYVVKTVINNKKGVPDILICKDGKFIAFEVKTDKGKTTKLQDHNLKEIVKAGGSSYIVRSVEDVKSIIEEDVLFTQYYLGGRVSKKDSKFHIEFSVLGEATQEWIFEDELEAKGGYKALEQLYTLALRQLQDKIVNAYEQAEIKERAAQIDG